MDYNSQLENYHSRLKEVLAVTGKLTETDLEYCKLLTQQEIKNYFVQAGVSGSFFSALVDAHKFFVEKSPSFVGRMNIKADRYIMSWREKIYYPIAYCKFMSSCIGDWKRQRKNLR